MVVLDSVALLLPKKEDEGMVGDAQMASAARMNSQGLRKLFPYMEMGGTTVMVISQIRKNIGGYGDPNVTTGGEAWAFYARTRIKTSKSKGESGEYSVNKFTQVKSNYGNLDYVTETSVEYGKGFNKEKELLKLSHRLTNIRHNYLHQVTSEIMDRKPKFIVLEDLNVKGMMKNRHLAKAVQEQCFYEFYRQIEYKSNWNNIEFVVADRYFPSSKLCSCCGHIKKDLKLSDRTYICSECGNTIDRDYQASVNLMRYKELTA